MSEKRAFKDAIYNQLSRIGKALGSPKRLEILDLLCQRSWTVEDLANETDQSIANTSGHLKVLREARLVEATKRGVYVEYAVAYDDVCTVCRGIRALAEHQLAEIERITSQFVAGREEFDSIDRTTLRQRLREGSVTLVDVRPEKEYVSGHLSGSVSIPVEDLPRRLREIPRDQLIVAYCRGPYCLFASDAVRLLRASGYNAVRYEEGVVDWKAAGLPVSVGIDPGDTSNGAVSRSTSRKNGPFDGSKAAGRRTGKRKP